MRYDTLWSTKPGNGSCYQVSGNIYGELYATMHEFHFVFAGGQLTTPPFPALACFYPNPPKKVLKMALQSAACLHVGKCLRLQWGGFGQGL